MVREYEKGINEITERLEQLDMLGALSELERRRQAVTTSPIVAEG